jgi:hypothetical protein
MRFYVVVYAEQKNESQLFQKTEEYINENIIKNTDFIEKLIKNYLLTFTTNCRTIAYIGKHRIY